MWKQRWYHASKSANKRNQKSGGTVDDDVGSFGTEFEEFHEEGSPTSLTKIARGANSITLQLSGPNQFSIQGRNKKIRSALKALPGAKYGTPKGSNRIAYIPVKRFNYIFLIPFLNKSKFFKYIKLIFILS